MKVLAIVPAIYNTSPGQRFRIEQWEPLLKNYGAEIDYAPFESKKLNAILHQPGNVVAKSGLMVSSLFKRFNTTLNVKKYDAVYIFREASLVGPAFFENLVKRRGVPFVFDFDDAIFLPNVSAANSKFEFLKSPEKTRTLCRLAAHVIAGNEYLAEFAGKVNSNITIIPTTIDTEKYQVVEKTESSEVPIIGWSGSITTVQHLDTIQEVFQDLAREEKFRLRVIGTPSYEISGVDAEAQKWKADTEVEDLGKFDIGVMPLPDDNWSRGKCGLKALQYMALGIPTICSPVGVNSTIIRDGENGFIASNKSEWVEKLKRLMHSFELRRKLGLAGRKTVEQGYSAKSQAERVFKVFESVVKEKVTI